MNLFSKSNLTLMNKIVLAFVGYVSLILVVFSLIIMMIDRGQVRGVMGQYADDVYQDRAALTRLWLEERIKDVQVLAGTTDVVEMNPNTAMVLLKKAVANHEDVYGRYYLIDTSGQMWDTLGITTTIANRYDFTASGLGEVIVTEPSQDRTFKQSTIEIVVPVIRDDGVVVGILGATVLLNDLSELVSDNSFYTEGSTWIVTKSGVVLSHNDPSLLATSIFDIEEGNYTELLNTLIEGEKSTAEFTNESKETEYVSFGPVMDGVDWILVASMYKSQVYSAVWQMLLNLSLVVLVIIMITFLVSWFLAKDITAPIQSLIEVTTKFTTGVKGIRATIDSKDEIGTLARSFNNMADTIVAHTDNLEELIKERTSILADLNYQIISRNKELGTMNEELEKTNNKLHELASKDMLTGLCNRHEFQRELQKTIELVNDEREQNFAVLFIDLDNFKYYNDTFSHEIGDYLLQMVSDILVKSVRGNDVVGRYGGDEFVILLREGDYEMSKTIATRIHKAILDKKGFKEELQVKLGADVKIMGKNMLSSSIGIVKYMKSMDIQNAEALLAKADETMYKAKKQGKSRVVVG